MKEGTSWGEGQPYSLSGCLASSCVIQWQCVYSGWISSDIKNLMSSTYTTGQPENTEDNNFPPAENGNKYHRVDRNFTAVDTIVFLTKVTRYRSHNQMNLHSPPSLSALNFLLLYQRVKGNRDSTITLKA